MALVGGRFFMNEVPLFALRFRALGLGFTVQSPHPDEGRILKSEEQSHSLDFSAVLLAGTTAMLAQVSQKVILHDGVLSKQV